MRINWKFWQTLSEIFLFIGMICLLFGLYQLGLVFIAGSLSYLQTSIRNRQVVEVI